MKAKIGYATAEEDLDVVRAMRKATGGEMAIMVDYNQSLTPPEAVRRLRVLDEEGLTWVEEPVLAHDYQGSDDDSAVLAPAIGARFSPPVLPEVGATVALGSRDAAILHD